jgi:hypothetical protein
LQGGSHAGAVANRVISILGQDLDDTWATHVRKLSLLSLQEMRTRTTWVFLVTGDDIALLTVVRGISLAFDAP